MRDTIDMAREAGFKEHNGMVYVTTINDDCAKEIERFEALVRADERNRTWTQEHWTEYEQAIVQAEREACAKVCETFDQREMFNDEDMAVANACAAAIRARGNT